MSTEPRAIGLVVEAAADERAAKTLCDRTLLSARDWLDDSLLDGVRSWRGVDPGATVTLWKTVPSLARVHGIRKHGHFNGEPGASDALAARRALLLFVRLGMPDAVILLRDADDQPERLRGLEQARMEARAKHVAIGTANPEREAWILAGFVPETDDETRMLDEERKRLGFDPSLHSNRLRGEGKRNAKQALRNLCGGEHEREHRCLSEPELEHLRSRGQHNGLAAFLDELETRVVPALT